MLIRVKEPVGLWVGYSKVWDHRNGLSSGYIRCCSLPDYLRPIATQAIEGHGYARKIKEIEHV
jgi:hypothetical protein